MHFRHPGGDRVHHRPPRSRAAGAGAVAAGVAAELPVKQIKKREKIPASSMPPGLVAGLTPEQLADLLAYLDTI